MNDGTVGFKNEGRASLNSESRKWPFLKITVIEDEICKFQTHKKQREAVAVVRQMSTIILAGPQAGRDSQTAARRLAF